MGIVNSQKNHNKHLAYLLNKQYAQNNVCFTRQNEYDNQLGNINRTYGDIRVRQ